eukprot:TRINITY_DN3851_c0_g5_i1.p1 TRINITY_DN3851_c0_g5~~TRINITY_DN3851_c0_g5_i1.p1  ORF type:complete len:485 (-),score=71.53 TRINITY_DN3851_c0_g5_i1:321-1775(-)
MLRQVVDPLLFLIVLVRFSEGFNTASSCGDDFLIRKLDTDYFRITYPEGDVIMCSEEANFCEMLRDLCPSGSALQGYNLTSSAAICVPIRLQCDGSNWLFNGNFEESDFAAWNVNAENSTDDSFNTREFSPNGPQLRNHIGGSQFLYWGASGLSVAARKSVSQEFDVSGIAPGSYFQLAGWFNDFDDSSVHEYVFLDEEGNELDSAAAEFPSVGPFLEITRHWQPFFINNIEMPAGAATLRIRFEGFLNGGVDIGYGLDELKLTCGNNRIEMEDSWTRVIRWPVTNSEHCVHTTGGGQELSGPFFEFFGNDFDYEFGLSSSTYQRLTYQTAGNRWFLNGENGSPTYGFISCASEGFVHPGWGPGNGDFTGTQEHCVAIGFKVQPGEEGFYRLENTNVFKSAENNNGRNAYMRIAVNDDLRKVLEVVGINTPFQFDMTLGYLEAGDVIYIAACPGDDNGRDEMRLDFDIERRSTQPHLLNPLITN